VKCRSGQGVSRGGLNQETGRGERRTEGEMGILPHGLALYMPKLLAIEWWGKEGTGFRPRLQQGLFQTVQDRGARDELEGNL